MEPSRHHGDIQDLIAGKAGERLLLALVLVFVMASAPTYAEERALEAEVTAYCDFLEKLASDEANPFRIFSDVASGRREAPPHWREFKTDEERAEQDTGENLNENAHVWLKDRLPVYVRFLYQSPSRDWAHYVNYCFRPEGALARISSELRTFYGRVRVLRTAAYSASREVLSRSERVLDLESGQPVGKERDFMDLDVPVFWSVSELPFYELLAPPGPWPNRETEGV